MFRIRLLKALDRWLGTTLAHLLPKLPASPRHTATIHAILLIRPGGIGDAVHLAPAIQSLRSHFPQVEIDILAERRNAGAFVLCPGIRQVYLYDHPGQLLQTLRNRYDAVIDTEQWHRLSAVVARLARSPVKIGYATNERARLFTHAIPYSHDDYEAASFPHLLEPLGIAAGPVPVAPWLLAPDEACKAAAGLVGQDDGRPLVASFPGASIAERRWGAGRFRAVAQWCGMHGLHVVVVGGREESGEGEQIVAGLDALSLAGRTSLAETAAILARATVVVSGDSGVLHIAVGLGRPMVSLFGAGLAAKWAPRGVRHIVPNRHLPCSPCTRFGYTPPCPIDTRCIKELAVADVTGAIDMLLAQPTAGEGA
jgi:lipopolysaccharide heptosyltransferase II